MTSKTLTQAAVVAAQLLLVVSSAHAGGPVVNVPEPMTLSLLGAGAAVAAVGAWWRNRK